ncbi:MAG: hypothetical protein QOH31_4891 [Verrucomicrobiota bacterium]|jgi:hypothetical protein
MRLKERNTPLSDNGRRVSRQPGAEAHNRALVDDFAMDDLPDCITLPVKGISHRWNPAILPLLSTQILHDRFDQTVNVVTGGFDIHFEARLSHRF